LHESHENLLEHFLGIVVVSRHTKRYLVHELVILPEQPVKLFEERPPGFVWAWSHVFRPLLVMTPETSKTLQFSSDLTFSMARTPGQIHWNAQVLG